MCNSDWIVFSIFSYIDCCVNSFFENCSNSRIYSRIYFLFPCLYDIFFHMNFTNMTLIDEALRIVFQMSIIVSGSLVFCEIVLRKFSRQIEKVGQILQIDKYSVMGIILSFGTSIAMLPLFSKMNQKGKILNAAFSLSGAFVFGGQLGFIAGVNPNSITWFVVVKLVAGIAGLLIANLCEKRTV
ncbi:MAG: ethanolamine utilization protein EutH [Bulleidia sp.]|nr:ethanolamine utilization protein EutH [Bulleidia sp.]